MLLADVVSTLDTVSGTRARSAKTDALAALLRRADPADAPALVGLLTGRLRQGKIGVGWRTVSGLLVSASHTSEPALTVAQADTIVDRIAAASTTAEHQALTRELFDRATSAEAELLARVLTGELRTGALEGVLVDAVARACDQPLAVVRRAAMLTGDLGATAQRALAAPETLAEVRLQVGVPVQPMLASPAASAAEAIHTAGESVIEHKLDGARIQVHRDGDEVLVVTRSLADVTSRVPEIVEHVRGLPTRQLILDGETLLLDDGGAPRPFQDTMSRFGRHGVPDAVLRPWFFDVLHADGTDLIDEPMRDRREVLAQVAGDFLIPGEVTDDAERAENVLSEALAAGQEGVMIKSLDAPYAAGRRGKAWLKVKPVLTYDLVVLAAEWGSGRRTGWLSNLHLGARDPDGTFGEPGGFVMVGKTFKGLTDEILRWQTETFPAYEVRSTAHTVFLRPELVVEIAIDGVQRSSRYPGGVALRFARVKGYRPDKTPAEADTIGVLRARLSGLSAFSG